MNPTHELNKTLLRYANENLEHARKRAYDLTLAVVTDLVHDHWPEAHGITITIDWEAEEGRPYPITHLQAVNCAPGGETGDKERNSRNFQELANRLLDYLPELVDVAVEPKAGIYGIRLEER